MEPYRSTQRVGVHPTLSAAGSPNPYFMGRGLLGRLRPVRVDAINAASWLPCLAHVVEWPFAEDDAGVAFDTANIWGLQTRVDAQPAVDTDPAGGDLIRLTAVPKILPAGYTAVGRCGRVNMFSDLLGADPFRGVVDYDQYGGDPYPIRPVRWRTPTGQYPTDLDDDGYLWVPMNLNQRVVENQFAFVGMTGWKAETGTGELSVSGNDPIFGMPYSGSNNFRGTTAILMGSPHIGFRGGALDLSYATTGWSSAFPVDFKLRARIRLGYSDAPKTAPDESDTIGFEREYTEADLTYQGWLYHAPLGSSAHIYTIRIEFGPILPPLGTRKHFMALYREQAVVGGTLIIGGSFHGLNVDSTLKWSPRTDVPAWFWSSTRNRIAPGGIVVPP